MSNLRHLLTVNDLSKEELLILIEHSLEYKRRRAQDFTYKAKGKVLGLLFDKPSTRTRISFEVAMMRLGGGVTFMSANNLQLSRGEPLSDTSIVLSRYLNCLVVRTYSQGIVEEIARHASIPVINGLTDQHHPCQAISDIVTVAENFGNDLSRLKIAWIGDGNNVCNSWIQVAAKLGLYMHIAVPKGYEPREDLIEDAKSKGAKIILCHDPHEAAKNAHVINTDVWLSMGEENNNQKREAFLHFQVNNMLLALADRDCIVLHCLPAHRGEEITDEVMNSKNSRIWDQAENKLYTHMAILEWIMGL